MKLIDILEIISDSTRVKIEDTEGEELAFYDGKDSIPEELNEREVVTIRQTVNKEFSDQPYVTALVIPCIVIVVEADEDDWDLDFRNHPFLEPWDE